MGFFSPLRLSIALFLIVYCFYQWFLVDGIEFSSNWILCLFFPFNENESISGWMSFHCSPEFLAWMFHFIRASCLTALNSFIAFENSSASAYSPASNIHKLFMILALLIDVLFFLFALFVLLLELFFSSFSSFFRLFCICACYFQFRSFLFVSLHCQYAACWLSIVK